ncbi:MAG: amino acid adenylation domain-containing protein [Bacteroidota bacterium]
MHPNTLIELLVQRSRIKSKGLTFIGGENMEEFLSYRELFESAQSVLGFLQSKGLGPKDELIFQVEDNNTFIAVFWACILGGIIPVPLSIGKNEDSKLKLFKVAAVLNNPYLITSEKLYAKIEVFAGKKGMEDSLALLEGKVLYGKDIYAEKGNGQIALVHPNDIAFIQFSSGSTGDPKGIILTHRNLLTNIEAISLAAEYSEKDSLLSWMPLTHDMGLIGFHLNPLFKGIDHYIIPTQLFVRRPSIWLSKASEHKVSVISSPNFGYHYVLKHCRGSQFSWDLSNVRILYNGAEPISTSLCKEFLEWASQYGLAANAMCPVYGLAEASLAVSISNLSNEVSSFSVERGILGVGDKVVEKPEREDGVPHVNVGKVVPYCSLRIVGNTGKPVGDHLVGHIQIKGKNVSSGYYNNREASERVLSEDGWMDTGDLGFLDRGNLYITGRSKEIIFVNGQNYYPHGIEHIATSVEGVELNKFIVIGNSYGHFKQEEIVGFLFWRGDLGKFLDLARKINKQINTQLGFGLDKILPVKKIPKTTSGKLQRFKLLDQYTRGDFEEVERSLELHLAGESVQKNQRNLPQSEIESELLTIWQDLLQREDIGLEEAFFSSGGNSLKAAELMMKVQEEFSVELTWDCLNENQSIKELSRLIPLMRKVPLSPILRSSDKDRIPLTPAQKRLFYAWILDKKETTYNIPVAFHLSGAIDKERLESCFQLLLQRHDVFRAVFHETPIPSYSIQAQQAFNLDYLISSWEDLNDVLSGLIQPFNLFQSPLIRSTLIQISEDEHILFLDVHHIISDGTSLGQLIQELFALYKGQSVPDLSIQFKDYVAWLEARQKTQEMEKQATFWESYLSGELPILDLPIDVNRSGVFNTKGEKREFLIDKEQTQKLKDFAKTHKKSLHTILFAVYNLFLAKFTQQNEFLVGIPVSGRRHPNLQNMQGMFVNNLPIRSHIQFDITFLEFAEAIHNNLLEAFNNQDYPYDTMVSRIGKRRDVSRNPLFDTMFIYQNFELKEENNDIRYTRYFFDPGTAKFDFSIEFFEEKEFLLFTIEYATSLFQSETISLAANYFQDLIEKVIANPNKKVWEYSLMKVEESQRFWQGLNSTDYPFQREKAIHIIIEEQAKAFPEKVAVEYNGEEVTYSQLDKSALHLAAKLQERGVIPGMKVAIWMDRSPELISSILGILKVGACYIPIATNTPIERAKYMLQDSGTEMVLINASSQSGPIPKAVGELEIAQIIVDKEQYEDRPLSIEPVNAPQDLAYIIYTSGTSGQPKGVMISHRALNNYIHWAAKQYIQGEQIDLPLFGSISFDMTVTSLFLPLYTGNSIIVYEDQKDGTTLIPRVFGENKSGLIKLTPSHLRLLRNNFPETFFKQSRVKRLIVGGERLEQKLAQDIYELFDSNIEIYNEYGPTEATVGCMIYKFDFTDHYSSVPIGKPIYNTQIYVLDSMLKPVPLGAKGELYISGEGLAEGYLLNEKLSNQKFISNPFAHGQKMYKTGDVVRLHPSGTIEYIGRKDNQIKINGFRIELAEIEKQLCNHPAIHEAILTLGENAQKEKYLKAYVRPNRTEEWDVKGVKQFLANRLPYYMIPSQLYFVDEIPLTQNGKVDKGALEGVIAKEFNSYNRSDAQAEIERVSIEVWEEVLGEKNISSGDNFYELGGDSIKAVQIASRLHERGISIQVKDILTFHTIELIGEHAHFNAELQQINQGMEKGFLSPWPIISWFFSQEFENEAFFNQSILLRLNKPIDFQKLEKAWNIIVTHHDGLRLNLDPINKKLFFNPKHIHTDHSLSIFTIQSDEELPELFTEVKSEFDLNESLLIKMAVIQHNGSPRYIFITAHHLVMDGISWRILLEDLYTAYTLVEQNLAIRLPRKTASLKDWGNFLSEYAEFNFDSEELSHWESIEEDSFSLRFKSSKSDKRIQFLAKEFREINEAQTTFLTKQLNRSFNLDISIVLLTSLTLSLRDWIDGDYFLLENENHGRHLSGINISRTVGWFTNMFPVKIWFQGASIKDQILHIKKQLMEVPNHGMGYGIQKYMRKRSRLSAGKNPEIRFNYLGRFDQEFDNELFSYIHRDTGFDQDENNHFTTKLEFNVMIVNRKLGLEICYSAKDFEQHLIAQLADSFIINLLQVIDHLLGEDYVYLAPSDFDTITLNQEELDALFE